MLNVRYAMGGTGGESVVLLSPWPVPRWRVEHLADVVPRQINNRPPDFVAEVRVSEFSRGPSLAYRG